MALCANAQGQDTINKKKTLAEVSVSSKAEGLSRLGGAENGTKVGQEVLFRAACCNLGKSFVSNPSVANYVLGVASKAIITGCKSVE